MNKIIDMIEKELNQREVVYFKSEEDGDTMLTIPLNLENAPSLFFKVYLSGFDGSLRSRKVSVVTKICTVSDKSIRAELMELVNEYNNKYSFGTFSITESGSVMYVYNYMINETSYTSYVMRYLSAMVSACEDVVPNILSLLWNMQKEEKEGRNADEAVSEVLVDVSNVDEMTSEKTDDTFLESETKKDNEEKINEAEPKEEEDESLDKSESEHTISAEDLKAMFLEGNKALAEERKKREMYKRKLKDRLEEEEKSKYRELFVNPESDSNNDDSDGESEDTEATG